VPTDVSRVLADLSRAFRACDLRCFVFGAQAVAATGVPRFTSDVDVTVSAPRARVSELVGVLQESFAHRDIGNPESFIAHTRVIPLVHRKTAMPEDVVFAGPGLEDARHRKPRS
jgi:hypothetical protein